MADQKNRGGQKQGSRQPDQATKKQGTTTEGAGERSDQDKRADQTSNPDDATRKGIADGDQVRVFSARGEIPMKARISTEVKPGILYCTFHFPEVLVNIVTSSEADEDTLCPEYKVVAVDVEKVVSPLSVSSIAGKELTAAF